jgi:hypothetical protein
VVYLVAGGVALFGVLLWLALHYAKKAERERAGRRILTEGRELEAEAEVHLDAPRRRGSVLVDRLRRKHRGDQTT